MQLKTVSGATVFSAEVITGVNEVEIIKNDEGFFATKKGKIVGQVYGKTVVLDGEEVKLADLVPSVDINALLAKNPIDLTKDELILVTEHLKGIAADKLNIPAEKPAKAEKAEKKSKAETPAKEEAAEESGEKVYTAAELEKLGAKDLWKQVIQPIADKLEGITSRSKKDEMIDAYLKFTGQAEEAEEASEEEEAPKSKAKGGKTKPAPVEEEEEDDEEEEEEDDEDSDDDSDDEDSDEDSEDDSDDEDEDEEEDDDDSDEEDEDEESDDDDDDDSDEDEDEESDDDEEEEDDEDEDEEDDTPVIKKPADVDAIESREELQAVIKKYGVKLPKGEKLNVMKVKQLIKEQVFKKGKK